MPLQPSTSTPQAFLMATPTSDINRPWSPDGGSDRHRVMPLPSPDPPGSSWWVELRGVRTLVPHVHLSVWLAGPRPSGSTDQSVVVRAAFHPHRRPPDQAALSFVPAAATAGRWWSLTSIRIHGASWRTMSATHRTLGPVGRNSRWTRSSATLTPGTRIVVRPRRLGTRPESQRPASAARRACAPRGCRERAAARREPAELHTRRGSQNGSAGSAQAATHPRAEGRTAACAARRETPISRR
jgi:hypothetical protein